MIKPVWINIFLLVVVMVAGSGCTASNRLGMVKDEQSGLMYGSAISGNFVHDPVQFKNPVIKLNLRNTSGDPAMNMEGMRREIEMSFKSKGYEISHGSDFGISIDINLVYSGQFSENRALEYGIMGGGAGGYAGYRSYKVDGAVIGTTAGATVGAILGGYHTEDTYLLVSEITLAVMDAVADSSQNVLSFGGTDIFKKNIQKEYRTFNSVEKQQVAVYAGGNCIEQGEIIKGVSARLRRILKDVI